MERAMLAMQQKKAFRLPLRSSSSRNRGLRAEEEQTGVDPRAATWEVTEVAAGMKEEERWSKMLPEILGEIVMRVESSDGGWPLRKSVVSCACVCRRWREVTTGVVGPPRETGKITFPNSLKQPGPSGLPIQCYIKRNKNNSTFFLYLSLSQTFMDKGKFLLAAQRFRRGAHIEYIISLDADDLSQGSNAYLGKLRSDFFGTKFKIYDSRAPSNGAKVSTHPTNRRFANKQISPQVPASNFEIGQVHYKFNLLKTKGPRRMLCTLQCNTRVDDAELDSVVLKNKAPRWHEHLQCWCLNFHGRVTIASVKNFQLVTTSGAHGTLGVVDNEPVLLQFGKIGDDMFTMDYREPLSAFQAFSICLASFGTKFACE